MSEDVPPYIGRPFVCAKCGDPVELDPGEAEALVEIERSFPTLATKRSELLCEKCAPPPDEKRPA